MKSISLATAAILALSVGTAGAATNLLSDGNFESFDSLVASNGFTKIPAGSPLLGAWTVGGTSVDLIQTNFGHITNVSIDLSGSPGPGSLSQGFTALAGYTYTLMFDHFKNASGTNLTVSFADLVPVVYTPPGVITTSTLVWTATSAGQKFVTFSGGGGNTGPTLDNVILTAIPEPGTYAMLLAGLAAVGFMVKRRRA